MASKRTERRISRSDREAGIAGVDEAGRGPLAGPVAVAAVILDPERPIPGLADSKTLGGEIREQLCARIMVDCAAYCVVLVARDEIDRINILRATFAGMVRAIAGLARTPRLAIVDGNRVPPGLH